MSCLSGFTTQALVYIFMISLMTRGGFITRIPLKGTLMLGKKDKLYWREEDESGFDLLVVYGLKWKLK
mgnify:CR=1 FL=1